MPKSSENELSAGRRIRAGRVRDVYRVVAEEDIAAIGATALRTEKESLVDLAATVLTQGQREWGDLREEARMLLREEGLEGFARFLARDAPYAPTRTAVLSQLARIVLLSPGLYDDGDVGLALLLCALKRVPPAPSNIALRLIAFGAMVEQDRGDLFAESVAGWTDFGEIADGLNLADLHHPEGPQGRGATGSIAAWRELFNRPFLAHGLEPVSASLAAPSPFDTLQCDVQRDPTESTDTERMPLVSVIMTAFRPKPRELLTSVRSILGQTHRHLELIVVDDASGSRFDELFEEVAGEDPRVQVISNDRQRGTFECRNIGFRASRGDFIAFQDDDDWSHPRRLERQLAVLDEHPDAPGSRARALRVLPNLMQYRYPLEHFRAAVTTVFRRGVLEQAGDYLPIHRTADVEMIDRIEALTGRPLLEVDAPLLAKRFLPDSLSGSDSRLGWLHPASVRFRQSFTRWHARAALSGGLHVDASAPPSIFIPERLRHYSTNTSRSLDVVVVADFRDNGLDHGQLLGFVEQQRQTGRQVGILFLESVLFPSRRPEAPADVWQDIVESGHVAEVLYDEPVCAQELVLAMPSVLQFGRATASRVRAGRGVVREELLRLPHEDERPTYTVETVTENFRCAFGLVPEWPDADRLGGD